MAKNFQFDFDDINEWGYRLQDWLSEIITPQIKISLQKASPKYVEDAGELLIQLTPFSKELVSLTIDWLKQQRINSYHGSRLTNDEVISIKKEGIKILRGSDREEKLRKLLLNHPNWEQLIIRLPKVMYEYAEGNALGQREGQAHTTLSRAALTWGFNHYLRYGAEFDKHVMQDLLGNEGLELLKTHGNPHLFQVSLPTDIAFEASSRFQIYNRDEIPNLVRTILESWAFWLTRPNYSPKSIEEDFGFTLYQSIPANWITKVIPLKDSDLDKL